MFLGSWELIELEINVIYKFWWSKRPKRMRLKYKFHCAQCNCLIVSLVTADPPAIFWFLTYNKDFLLAELIIVAPFNQFN